MNTERLALRGRLAEAKETKTRAEAKVKALADAIRLKLNAALVAFPADLDVPAAAALMDELVEYYGELVAAVSEISRLEKELD